MPDDASKRWRSSPELWNKLGRESRRMRLQPTAAELALWDQLRARRLDGLRFRRQHAIDRFIVDFYCAEARLVVEVDGPVHDSQSQADADRDEILRVLGLNVLHFTNTQVMQTMNVVLASISRTASALSASGEGSSPSGERVR